MKKILSILLLISFCTVLSGTAQGEEPKTKPKVCEYKGTINGKLENPDRITIATQGGPQEFYFKHDGKRECVSFKNLTIGDNVSVTCKDKKEGLEATCVQKIPKGTTLQGGSISGGKLQ